MMRVRDKGRTRAVFAVLLAGALFAAGCGSSDSASESDEHSSSVAEVSSEESSGAAIEDSASTEDTEVEQSDDQSGLAAEAEALFVGTFQAPPSDAPTPAEGKSVWVISCGEAAAGCSELAGGAVEAAETIGWDVTLFDGRLGVDGAYAAGIRQAVAAETDAIIIGSVDCVAIAQPLAEAREAGIVIVGMFAYDCDDERHGGSEQLFDASVFPSNDIQTVQDDSLASGDARAVWFLNQVGTSGHKVLVFRHVDSLLGSDMAAGFEARIEAECGDCEILPVEFTYGDLASGAIGSKAADALVKHPDADGLFVPYDSLLLLGVAQSVLRSGRVDEVTVVGGEGYAPNLDLIQTNGGQDVAVGASARWGGWGSVDTLNRLFAGVEPVPQGYGFRLIDADHMVGIDGIAAQVTIDYRAAYRQAWGV